MKITFDLEWIMIAGVVIFAIFVVGMFMLCPIACIWGDKAPDIMVVPLMFFVGSFGMLFLHKAHEVEQLQLPDCFRNDFFFKYNYDHWKSAKVKPWVNIKC